jgi:hypothetical protein
MVCEQVHNSPPFISNNLLHLRINFPALGVIELYATCLKQFVEFLMLPVGIDRALCDLP